jgi:hypothetical protein
MKAYSATGQNTKTTFREAEQKARAFDGTRAVRVFGETGNFLQRLHPTHDGETIRRLLAVPNAEAVRKHGGELVGIRLLSVGDDRGSAGPHNGRSTVTTERVRNDLGVYIGTEWILKHKGDHSEQARFGNKSKLGRVPFCREGSTCAANPMPQSN